MQSAIDTNIISALWSREPASREVVGLLVRAREAGALVVSAPVYAELLAHPGADEAFVEQFLRDTNIRVDFDLHPTVWLEAGKKFASYAVRRRASGGGEAKRLLVDFVVGAHALLLADQLLTLDPNRYRTDFLELRLVPEGAH